MSEKRFRVLLAEPTRGEISERLQALYQGQESKLELSAVSTLPTLLATIELAAPEVILLDLSLGRPNPVEAVRRVHRAAPGIPLIVFSDLADRAHAGPCLAEGAMDYVLKRFMDASTLERALRMALERNTLDGLASLLRDPLTGLHNRDGFLTLCTRAMEEAARCAGTLVLLCARIENLSELREERGTGAGDQAVRDIGGLLRSCFRRGDFVARLGEAQFAALAVDAAEPSAPILRQRVESRLAIQSLMGSWNPVSLRISVGYWDTKDARSFGEFLDAVESELRQPEAMLVSTEMRK